MKDITDTTYYKIDTEAFEYSPEIHSRKGCFCFPMSLLLDCGGLMMTTLIFGENDETK